MELFFLDWEWLAVPNVPAGDQGMDVIVEPTHDGAGIGRRFLVSVKANNDAEPLTAPFERRTLKKRTVDYLMRQEIPIFLMLVRRKERRVYWLDLNKAFAEGQRSKAGGFNAKIPTNQYLTIDACDALMHAERKAFLNVFEAADAAWRLPTDAHVATAIKAQEAALEALDDRCVVEVIRGSNHRTVKIFPKQEMPFTMHLTTATKSDAEKLAETVKFGVPNTIALKKFKLEGSKLWEELIPQSSSGQITIGSVATDTMRVAIAAKKSKSGVPISLRFAGPITRGHRRRHRAATVRRKPSIDPHAFERRR